MDKDEFIDWIKAMTDANVSPDIAAQVAGQLFLGQAQIDAQAALAETDQHGEEP